MNEHFYCGYHTSDAIAAGTAEKPETTMNLWKLLWGDSISLIDFHCEFNEFNREFWFVHFDRQLVVKPCWTNEFN